MGQGRWPTGGCCFGKGTYTLMACSKAIACACKRSRKSRGCWGHTYSTHPTTRQTSGVQRRPAAMRGTFARALLVCLQELEAGGH